MNFSKLKACNDIVIFSVPECKYCEKLKRHMQKNYPPQAYTIVNINRGAEEYQAFREDMLKDTQWYSYPFVFQNAKFVGGCNEFMLLDNYSLSDS